MKTPDFGTKLEAIKHIGEIVDGKLVCREDCPSVTHNTPDTEKRKCEACGRHLYPDARRLCGHCLENGVPPKKGTPDTEWREEIKDGTALGVPGSERVTVSIDWLNTLRTSRDTYWKEKLDWRNRKDGSKFHDGDDVVQWYDKQIESITNEDNLK